MLTTSEKHRLSLLFYEMYRLRLSSVICLVALINSLGQLRVSYLLIKVRDVPSSGIEVAKPNLNGKFNNSKQL